MKIELIVIGKTNFNFIEAGIQEYKIELNTIFLLKSSSYLMSNKNAYSKLKEKEAEFLLDYIQNKDVIYSLLDDKGKEYTSLDFSDLLQDNFNYSRKSLGFIIGGAYGFSQDVYSAIPKRFHFQK